MAPPTGPLNLDVEAISGICGSISIAAWVVVFSPQIIENFRRSSADGLSLHFIIIWLAGDVFNILGAVLQDVLPTMIILAVYYTIADLVLLAQCFYYKGFTLKDEPTTKQQSPPPRKVKHHHHHADEVEAANGNAHGNANGNANERTALLNNHFDEQGRERRGSDWSHLNPAAPMLSGPPATPPPQPTRLQTAFWNSVAVLMVCAAGIIGWYLSRQYSDNTNNNDGTAPREEGSGGGGLPAFSLWGQIFGWFCAVLYLGSRLPQMLLNWRRKSTDGVSMLFFLFACLGNLTYVLSIFAYDPHCAGSRCEPGEASRIYGRYILVNLSWLAGSLGTLFLDLGIFAQFFIYSQNDGAAEDEDEDEEQANGVVDDGEDQGSIDESRWDQRPLLDRSDSYRRD